MYKISIRVTLRHWTLPRSFIIGVTVQSRPQILIWRADAASKSLPQAAKLPVQGKVDFGENACVFAERRMRSFS